MFAANPEQNPSLNQQLASEAGVHPFFNGGLILVSDYVRMHGGYTGRCVVGRGRG